MNVLALIRSEEELPSVVDYAKKFTSAGDELYVMNIIDVPAEIPTKQSGEVLDDCTEFNLSNYLAEQRTNKVWIGSPLEIDIPLQREVVVGNRISILNNRISRWEIDLILTSSELSTEFKDLIGKTRAERIKNKLSIPILNLKCDRRKEVIERIAIVSDFEENGTDDIPLVKHIAEAQGAEIALFSFSKDGSDKEQIEARMQAFAQEHDLQEVEKHIIVTKDKESSIQKLLLEHSIQLMVTLNLERHGLKKLFKGDLEADLLNNMMIPILAL